MTLADIDKINFDIIKGGYSTEDNFTIEIKPLDTTSEFRITIIPYNYIPSIGILHSLKKWNKESAKELLSFARTYTSLNVVNLTDDIFEKECLVKEGKK